MSALLNYVLSLLLGNARVCWDGGELYVVNCWPHVEMKA